MSASNIGRGIGAVTEADAASNTAALRCVRRRVLMLPGPRRAFMTGPDSIRGALDQPIRAGVLRVGPSRKTVRVPWPHQSPPGSETRDVDRRALVAPLSVDRARARLAQSESVDAASVARTGPPSS